MPDRSRPPLPDLTAPGTVLLDGPRLDADTGRRQALLFTDPVRVLRADRYGEVEGVLRQLDAALAEGDHVAGLLAYEAGYALERFADRPVPDGPLAWFGVYGTPQTLTSDALAASLPEADVSVDGLRYGLSRDAYWERVGRVLGHIREGDVYQINLTAPFTFRTDADGLRLYAALRSRQPVAYGAFLRLPDRDVASVSPELFFRVDPGDPREITARPMKGTAPRGRSPEADAALVATLLEGEKDRAENLMIVDLLRNDLSRVSLAGSVRVPSLFEAERYETLTQMTSTVRADLRPDAGLGDVLRALFPCGSVVGAPKLRAQEIIRQLEDRPRGAYCGAIGYAAPGDAGGLASAAFNVAIRTAVVERGEGAREGRYDVGSGIVWDSEADAEYDECLLKARVLTELAR